MSAPKIVCESSKKESPNHDKKIIEALIKRLNDQIKNDEKSAKRAALIIAEWLKEKTRP